MDLYSVLKLLHVGAAILWAGTTAAYAAQGVLAARRGQDHDLPRVIQGLATVSPHLLARASWVAILSGLALAWAGSWGWQAWNILALAGVAVVTVLGYRVSGPLAGRTLAAWAAGEDAALPLARRTLRWVKVEGAVLFGIVALMVLKPGWGDLAILGGLGAVLALAVALSLTGAKPALEAG